MKLLFGLFAFLVAVAGTPAATISPSDRTPLQAELWYVTVAHAQEVPLPPVKLFMEVVPQVDHIGQVKQMVLDAQAQYGLDYTFYNTLECESKFINEQSQIPHAGGPGGLEDSWGVAQIHLPAHPDVTKEEALDPAFAIEWAAQQFAAGRQDMWTCYNLR